MLHVRSVLVKSKYESIGFSMTPKFRKMSLRMWEGGRLLDLAMLRRDQDALVVASQLSGNAVCGCCAAKA